MLLYYQQSLIHHSTWHGVSTKDIPWQRSHGRYWRNIEKFYISVRYQKNALLTHLNSLQSMQIDLLKESLPCTLPLKRFWRNRMMLIIENLQEIIDTLRIHKVKRNFDERKVYFLDFYNLATNNLFYTALRSRILNFLTFFMLSSSFFCVCLRYIIR